MPVAAQHANHGWTYDFIFDATAGGKRLKMLRVLDECTRVALALVPRRSLASAAVKGVLAGLFAHHGWPLVIRCDKGPEFIAFELVDWLDDLGAACLSCEEVWGLEHARVVSRAVAFGTTPSTCTAPSATRPQPSSRRTKRGA